MSDKRTKYSTVIFDAILAASSDRIVEVIYRWLYKEYHEVSIHIESPPKSGTVTFLFIQLRLNDDGDQIGKPHQHAGSININGDTLGSHVVVSFFDWETADDRSDAYSMARIHNYATLPNQRKTFEQLAQALRRDAIVLQDNLKEMGNESIEQQNILPPSYTEDLQKVKELSLIPLTITQISIRLGLSVSTIKRHRKKLGLTRRKK